MDPQAEGQARVLLFLHPGCPCNRTTLASLSRLQLSQLEVVLCPSEGHSRAISRLQEDFPLLAFRLDARSRLARSYGVWTSGQILAYRADGRLWFSAGLTSGRGLGVNPAGLEALLQNKSLQGEVYGCPVRDPFCSQVDLATERVRNF